MKISNYLKKEKENNMEEVYCRCSGCNAYTNWLDGLDDTIMSIKLTKKQYEELSYQYHIVSDNDKTIGSTNGWILEEEKGKYYLTLPIDSIEDTKKLFTIYSEGSLDNQDIGSYNMFRNLVKKLVDVLI
jgi:hypothetical protein